MYKKGNRRISAVLWFIFLMMIVGIAVLSFENGERSKQLGEHLIARLALARHPGVPVTEAELLWVTYVIRQMARVAAFLGIGILGTVTVHVSMKNTGWMVKTIISGGILFTVAYFTEELKKYIPSRHYSYKEMMLSITAVAAGFLFVSFISLLKQGIKRIFQLAEIH